MPLTRYHLRNEYSLADPELYRAADKDDPEALLEGVAMTGLIGVLRQLGDLAEFAAEIFRDLHEEVMATAARGHGLMVRVQQIEAEVPSVEKAFLSQTTHSLFFSNAGIDWHPNMHMEHNLITREDLPRFVMDSYEECHGPPRLFLLDKFDVSGAGSCLKRYTDPSFFKVGSGSSGLANVDIHKEKKIRKVKKKGSRWRNRETTPEIGPVSHVKLQQLFLEERVNNGVSDPSRLVKLKRRQLNDSPFDSKNRRSYMKRFIETTSPENKIVCEVSVTLPPFGLTSVNKSELGRDIIEIGTVSPDRMSTEENKNPCLSLSIKEVVPKPSVDKLNENCFHGETFEHPEPSSEDEPPEHHFNVPADDVTSEVDNYVDALASMESEMETDNDYRSKNPMESEMESNNELRSKYDVGLYNVKKHGMYYDASEEQIELTAQASDSQSIGNSYVSDDGNISFTNYRSSLSYCDTVSNVAEDAHCVGGDTAEISFSSETYVPDIVDIPSDQLSESAQVLGVGSGDIVRNRSIEEHKILALGNESCSTLTDSNLLASGCEVSSLEASSVGPDLGKASLINKLDSGSTYVVSDALHYHSNGSDLVLENESGTPVNQVLQTEYEDQNCAQTLVTRKNGSLHSDEKILPLALPVKECSWIASPQESLSSCPCYNGDSVEPYNVIAEFDDTGPEVGINSENSTPGVCNQSLGILDCQFSGTTKDVLHLELDASEIHFSNSEKTNLNEIPMTVDDGETGAFVSNVGSEDNHVLSNYSNGLDYVDRVTLERMVSESVKQKDLVVSAAAVISPNEDFTVISPLPDLSDSSSSDLVNFQSQYPHKKGLESEGESAELIVEQHDAIHATSRAEQSQNSLQVCGFSTALTSSDPSDQESESISHQICLAENTGNDLPSHTTHLLQPNQLKEHFQADETIYKAPDLPVEQIQTPNHIIQEVEASKTCTGLTDEPSVSVSLPPSACPELVGTEQTIYPSDMVCSSFIAPLETQLNHDSDSCNEDVYSKPSSSEIESQSADLELGGTKKTLELYDCVLPSFSVHPGMIQVNLDEMPPLPPLPPIQWRLGKTQQDPLGLQRVVKYSHDSLQSTQPSTAAENNQDNCVASARRIVQPSNPILTGESVEDDEMQFSSNHSVAALMPISLQLQIKGNDTNNRHDVLCLERTESLNPFLSLPATSNAMPAYGVGHVGTEMVMSNFNPLPPTPTISDTTSRVDLVLSEVQVIEPHQVAPETGSEANMLHHTTQGSEEKQRHLLETVVPPPTNEAPRMSCTISNSDIVSSDRKSIQLHKVAQDTGSEAKMHPHTIQGLEQQQGNPIETFVPPTIYENNQPRDGFLLSFGEKPAYLSNTSPLLPVPEVGELNENPTNKIPRPRSPLIEAVASHDKSSLKKVTDRVRPQIAPKIEERDSLLEQIRMKSFNLKPAVVARPSIQGPKTNLRVAAILEKANAIRQAFAGSDEDDDADSWSE